MQAVPVKLLAGPVPLRVMVTAIKMAGRAAAWYNKKSGAAAATLICQHHFTMEDTK